MAARAPTRCAVRACPSRNELWAWRSAPRLSFKCRRRLSRSALLTEDAALDKHHDRPGVAFLVTQAITSGCRKGLTLLVGLPISRFHVIHHVAPVSLFGASNTSDTDDDEHGNCQCAHDVHSSCDVASSCDWLTLGESSPSSYTSDSN